MTLTWPDIRTQYTERYGQHPGPQLEAALVDHFERHPSLFTAEADRAAHDHANGTIRSPWVILARRLHERATQETRYAGITATDAKDREQAIRLAERRLRTLAPHLETETDVLAELFSPPELTADTDMLERIVAITADTILQPLAQAQLAHTNQHGRQTVPGTGGILRTWDTPELRQRILNTWHELRPSDILTASVAEGEPEPFPQPNAEWTT